jgi:FkbM family methyltransferase
MWLGAGLAILFLAVGATRSQGMLRMIQMPAYSSVSQQMQRQRQAQIPLQPQWPDTCTSVQLETIAYQLPAKDCIKNHQRPWNNRCSFSFASRCPASNWLTEYYAALHSQQQQSYSNRHHHQQRTALSVGCNKGMDAVNTLRMLAGDAAIDKDTWSETFFGSKSKNASKQEEFENGRCQQEFDAQFQVQVPPTAAAANSNYQKMNAAVYCVEAMPATAAKLHQTANTLKWQDRFHVIHAAVGAFDNEAILFPSVDKVGVENMGLSNCKGKVASETCKPVQQYTLDSLVDAFMQKSPQSDQNDDIIDMISVDVEGYDWPVLLGGANALRRTRYVELEYNWRGEWNKYKLSNTTETMKERGFVCYWAGDAGRLWRITDCWLSHYDLKFWSNVACVNVLLPDTVTPSLAERMEATFLDTVAAGNTIQYNHALPKKRKELVS